MTDEGNKQELRIAMRHKLNLLHTATDQLAAMEVWDNVDVLPIPDLETAAGILELLIDRANRARGVVARAQAKRSAQSVSGRFSTFEDTGRKRRTP
jgi:hypothetical protein